MRIDNSELIDFLSVIDRALTSKIRLTAVGGTAMTLLKLKESTIDVDFELSNGDYKIFKQALRETPHGFKVDLFVDGLIFSQQLPEDFLDSSIAVKTTLKNIRLFALHPLDIVVTKIGRLNDRDIQDIDSCIHQFGLVKSEIKARAASVEYTGNRELYKKNLAFVLKKFWK